MHIHACASGRFFPVFPEKQNFFVLYPLYYIDTNIFFKHFLEKRLLLYGQTGSVAV
jgi:hypothetical protein